MKYTSKLFKNYIALTILLSAPAFLPIKGQMPKGQRGPSAILPTPIVDTVNVERYDWQNISKHVGTTQIVPFFHHEKDMLWYAYQDPATVTSNRNVSAPMPDASASGLAYRVFDIKKGKRNAKREEIDRLFKRNYPYINPYGTSPDSLWRLSEDKDKNLCIENLRTHEKRTLSNDGAAHNDFEIIDVKWTADGHFFLPRKDHRKVRHFDITYYGVMPPMNNSYEYEIPGDTNIVTTSLYIGNASTGSLHRIDTDKWRWQNIAVERVKDVDHRIYFWREKRTRDVIELCYADTLGNVTSVLTEESKPYINPDLRQCLILNQGNDIFLWSDRTGWGHIYHYDATGKLLGAVTSGEWTAGKIVKADPKHRRLYFYGYGRERGRNPIYAHLYSVGFDGKAVKLLTPENANHQVFINDRFSLIVDNFSRIDTVPQTSLRRTDGRLITMLESADLSDLKDYGWKFPEIVQSKAADGTTDLYGIMWKPFDFDPSKKYPVISQVYPGPFTDTVWGSFTLNDKYANEALAQRGFIVVVMGHRGSNPYRSKDYRTYGYGNLRDNCIEDDRYALEHLAKSHPYMDMNRVGIFGHSGGGMMAFAALCTYPDFYKCAVASSGNHDNNIYNRTWGETYQGIGEDAKFKVATNMQLAEKLSRPLLLVTGDADQNVHPAHTLRLTDALIKANKDFELLIMPGCGHHYEDHSPLYRKYFERRKRDFFVKNLK